MKHGDPIIDILLKRERLLAVCAAQRDELAVLAQQFEGPLKIANGAVAAVHYLRRHPIVLGAAVALLTVIERRRLWIWARRGFSVWRTYRALRNTYFKSAV